MDLIDRAAAVDYLMLNMGWYDEDGREVDDSVEKRPIIEDLVSGIPTIPAVPLEPLCEWLSDHAGRPMDCIDKLCGKCEFDGVGVGQEKCWENLIRKWMEGKHEPG